VRLVHGAAAGQRDVIGQELQGRHRLGRFLRFDAQAEKFIDDPEADKLLGRECDYRKPFVVPEKV
jgi:hypothetical protein